MEFKFSPLKFLFLYLFILFLVALPPILMVLFNLPPSRYLFLYFFLNFLIGIFIFRDVRKRLPNELHPAIVWFLSALIGGPFVLLVYFLFRPRIASLGEYVCPNCGKRYKEKFNFCPNCRKQIIKMSQTSLSEKRSLSFTIWGSYVGIMLICLLAFLLMIIGVGTIEIFSSGWDKIYKIVLEKTKKAQPTRIYNIGEMAKLKDRIVTVYSFENYQEPNEFLQPKTENKYVAIEVGLENTSDHPIVYDSWDFVLEDKQGNAYSQAVAFKQPKFSYGTLSPGAKVRGFIVYEIPKSASELYLRYFSGPEKKEQVIFNLVR